MGNCCATVKKSSNHSNIIKKVSTPQVFEIPSQPPVQVKNERVEKEAQVLVLQQTPRHRANLKSPASASVQDKIQSPQASQQKQQRIKKVHKMFDLSFPDELKPQIFKITTIFPVTKPYCSSADFDKILQKYRLQQQQQLNSKFVSPEYDRLSDQILELKNRNWIQDLITAHQQYIQTLHGASFDSLVKHKRLIQLREQFNWIVWAISYSYFVCQAANKQLPQQKSQKWSEGFEFKGLFVQLLPIEKADYLLEEVKALSQLQIELMQVLSNPEPKSKLSKQIIVPLIAIVKCGAFLIFSTPLIYTQELKERRITVEIESKGSTVLPRISSMTQARSDIDINNLLPDTRESFSYLHQNIENSGQLNQEAQYFTNMPVLKNLKAVNLIPVIDFEKIGPQLQVNYLVTDVIDCIRTISTQSSSHLFMIPSSQEEIIFKKFPSSKQTTVTKIRKILNQGDSVSGIGRMKPKGDIQFSPQESLNFSIDESSSNINQDEEVRSITTKKNGWSLMLIQMDQQRQATQENKRATQLLNLSKSAANTDHKKKFAQTSYQMLQPLLDQQSVAQQEDTINGCCLVNAKFDKGFNVLPALTHVNYAQGIETLFKTSLLQVSSVLNDSQEKILNISALKELMHRKGLNIRFLWLLLPKLKIRRARDLVMVSILLRTMKKVVFQKVSAKCKHETQDEKVFYNASSGETFKESIAMFVNAVLKNKFAKYKTVFDETLLGLFLHRLKVMSLVYTIDLPYQEVNYLESKDILDHILESPSTSPTLFLNSVQSYFKIHFTNEFTRVYRQDCFSLLNKNQPLTYNDFKLLDIQVIPVLTLREYSYFVLARRISQDSQSKQPGKDDVRGIFKRTNDKQIFVETEKSIDTMRQKPNQQSDKQQNTHRNFQNLNQSINRSFNLIDLSKKKVNLNFEFNLPSILYKIQSPTKSLFQGSYELPSIDQINEWVIILDSLLKDCFSPCYDNSDQVLAEALCLQAMSTFLIQDDQDGVFKILQRIRVVLQEALSMSPEIISQVMMITGLWSDQSQEVDLIESERNYIAAMISLMSIHGDPRGRGNSGLPIMMFYAWKLQILSQAGKKTQDSELAEEIFDACLHGFINYKKAFKNRTQQVVLAQERAYRDQEKSQVAQQIKLAKTAYNSTEYSRLYFDIKQYKDRPKNVLTAGGLIKSQVRSSNKSVVESKQFQTIAKQNGPTMISHLQKLNYDADLSDIDVKFLDDDEAELSRFSSVLANQEVEVENIPFPHWMINRQIFMQQEKSLAKETQSDQKAMIAQLVRETLNSLHPQALLQWLVTYNSVTCSSGHQWDSQTTKEFCFGQQSQLLSNSGSSATYSQTGKSINSSRVDGYQMTQRRRHLGSYTQIFGKEVGGIQKSEISGLVYIWGTDSSGQLGLDHFCPQQKQSMMITAGQNLKLQHPRICIPLKDEVIKEICCGYSFTFAVNHYGQTFCWGANECGQLGLGQESMSIPVVRSPQINPYLTSVAKLSAGNEHALALTKSGELFVWGSAILTGLGDTEHRPVPTIIVALSSNNVKQISCGGLHSMVLTKQGQVYTWGSNEGGQLGLDLKNQDNEDSVLKPTLVDALIRSKQFVIQIACGETHSVVLTREHKIWGWGMSMYGQLGLGFSADSFEPGVGLLKSKVLVPVEITPYLPTHVNVMQVYCGAAFTLMQTKEGELYGCGINDLGQLGLDTYIEDAQLALIDRTRQNHQVSSDVTVPSKVICFEKMNVQQIACGENHSLAVIGEDKNMLWSWGMFKNGQLGLGEVTMKMNPRPIQTLCAGHIYSIAAGSQHSVALLGEQAQMNSLTTNYFVNTDILNNPWIIDIRQLDESRQNQIRVSRN